MASWAVPVSGFAVVLSTGLWGYLKYFRSQPGQNLASFDHRKRIFQVLSSSPPVCTLWTPRISTMNGNNFIRNSVPLPDHVYQTSEYFCKFKPRIHRDTRLADAGSWQCQVDFLQSSNEARADADRNKDVSSYAVGCINPIVGNFTALCAVEALPERLALTTYMVEYAYIHDDGK